MLIPALTGPFLAMGRYSRFSAGVRIAKKKFSVKSFPGIYLKSLAMGKIRSML